jgi:hypothetical protein
MLIALMMVALIGEPVTGAPGQRPPIIRPDWTSKPSANDMARAYPPEAARQELAGGGGLTCKVDGKGALIDCVPWTKLGDPPMFEAAFLRLAPLFRMRASDAEGRPVEGREIKIPIRFLLPSRTLDDIVVADPSLPDAAVKINCRASPSGIDNCLLMSEEPRGEGAAEAALKLAPNLKIRSTVPARFQVTLAFKHEESVN